MSGKPLVEAAALARVVAGYPALGAFRGVVANGLSINTPASVAPNTSKKLTVVP